MESAMSLNAIVGPVSYTHLGNRGRKPANTIPNETHNLVVDLYRNKYYDANFEHFTELLGKHEDIYISPSAVMSLSLIHI